MGDVSRGGQKEGSVPSISLGRQLHLYSMHSKAQCFPFPFFILSKVHPPFANVLCDLSLVDVVHWVCGEPGVARSPEDAAPLVVPLEAAQGSLPSFLAFISTLPLTNFPDRGAATRAAIS